MTQFTARRSVRRHAVAITLATMVAGSIFLVATPASAADFTVTSTADTLDAGTLRSAMAAAESSPGPDVITIVATGTIQLTSDLGPISLGALSIVGPGSASLTILPPASTGQPVFVIDPDGSYEFTFSGMTIDGGSGGIAFSPHTYWSDLPYSLDLKMNDVTVKNSVSPYNAALSIRGQGAVTLAVTGSTFANNAGSAIDLSAQAGNVTIDSTTFDGNRDGSNQLACVLGWSLSSGQVTISNSTISNNVCEGPSHSPIANRGNGSLTILQSTFSGNVVSGADFVGSAIAYELGSGGVGNLDIENSTFVDNRFTHDVSATSSGMAGTIFSGRAATSISNSIFYTAPSLRQGEVALAAQSSQLTVDNSLFGLSEATYARFGTETPVATNNLFSSDPLVGVLAYNGGLTMTHLLLAGSPAINTGDPAWSGADALDQRLVTRVISGIIDIGAVEYVPDEVSLEAPVEPQLPPTGLNGAESALIGATSLVLGLGLLGGVGAYGRSRARRS